ncbi:MAG: hypothetical protein JWQ27_394 [Ferruginibacter sp.]|nr:hypothetical protein [Ferruginibacter sp.]
MTTEYKIDLRHQLKSFRECLYLLAWTIGAFIIGVFVVDDQDYKPLLIICLLFWLVTCVGMALPFHINYLKANWKTKLIVDNNLKSIEIIQSGKVFSYDVSQIQVTRYILGHYRPDRTKSWTPVPFDYYGFLQVTTNDDKEYFLTSLMLDPFNSPLPIHRTEYEFPIIWKH